MAKSFLGQANVSRGLRNNNPGNLVKTNIPWQGKIPLVQNTDSYFEQFYDVNHGIRAMALDTFNDVKDNDYTLSEFIQEYAPPSENDTTAYLNFVATQTGIQPGEKLKAVMSADTLLALIKAQIKIENGNSANLLTDDDIRDSIRLMPQLVLQQLDEFIKKNQGPIITVFIFVALGGFLLKKWL